MPRFYSPFLYLLFLCGLLSSAKAQNKTGGLWDNVKQSPAKVGKAAAKTGGKIRKFKKHLQEWGLDTAYNHGLAIGARLNSNGWTGLLFYQQRKSRSQSSFYQLAFSEVKHEKQVKQQRDNIAFPAVGISSPYVFGKIKNLYTLQLGYGREYLLLPGVLDGNLSISARVQAGISLAMLKPYYLKLIYVDYNPDEQARVQEEKYSDANSDKFLNTGYILGASRWGKGVDEVTYVPGGYVDAAIVIEPLKNKSFIKTVTLGGSFAMHSKSLEIMTDQKAYPWTASLFVGLSVGKRWR